METVSTAMHAFLFLWLTFLSVPFVLGLSSSSSLLSERPVNFAKCPNVCRFYQVHWAGECNGIFHEATCPVTCGANLQEVYDSRKLSHYVMDDWKRQKNGWRTWVEDINPKTKEHGKPDLGVAATCELFQENNYRCISTVVPPPITQWARDALAVASNNTRITTSPDLKMFCVCNLQCTKGVRVPKQIPRFNVTKCNCPSWSPDRHPDGHHSLGYEHVLYT